MIEAKTGPFPGIVGPFTAKAIERLKTGKPGDSLTAEQMGEIVGRDCSTGSNGRGNVDTAIRHVETNHGIVWRWDRGKKAWTCLDGVGRVQVERDGISKARRTVGRVLRVARTVDVTTLPQEIRKEHELNVAAAGMVYLCGSGSFRKKLASADVSATKEPDVDKLIQLMKPNGEK